MRTLQNGFWSGILATSAMTLSFLRLFKNAPLRDKAPLPPARLTHEIETHTGAEAHLKREGRIASTLISHYGYGVGCSMIYSLFARHLPKSTLPKGLAFGFSVWAASYLGLIPALGLETRATKMSSRQNLAMIGAHLVFGVALAYAEKNLRKSGTTFFDGASGPIA